LMARLERFQEDLKRLQHDLGCCWAKLHQVRLMLTVQTRTNLGNQV
jgi:hypothetical protein